MASKKTLTLKVRIDGVRETLKAFDRLASPEHKAGAEQQLRKRSKALAETLAASARAAASAAPAPQAALVAKTVAARTDRLPVVQAGGKRKLGRHKVPAWRLLFASEFGQNKHSGWYAKPQYGASTGDQYPRHQGRGYWFFPTVEREGDRINREWNEAADEILKAFSRSVGEINAAFGRGGA